MKSAKSYGFCSGQEKINQPIKFRYVRGGKQTLVCYRTVHSSTVVSNLKNLMFDRTPLFIYLVGLLFFTTISCREKSFEEYHENEFYKAQGIVVSAKITSTIMDNPYMKEIQFEYFINDSLILKNSEDLSFMDLEEGIPIEVLVHKENPEISFYWRNGFTDSITAFQVQYVKSKMEKVISEIEKATNK